MKKLKQFFSCFYYALVDTVNHDGVEHAGYLAFLGLLSFFPFLVFFVALVGFMGESQSGSLFIDLLLENVPSEFTEALQPRIHEITSGPPQGLLTLAIVGAIWTASSAVEGLRTTLNRAYRVGTPPAYIWRRLLSIAQFLFFTAAMMIAMFFLILAPTIWDEIEKLFNISGLLAPHWTYIRYAVVVFVLFFIVVSLYYLLPNIKQRWSNVAPGAMLVVLGWVGSGWLLALYIHNFNQVHLIYGSLGGFIIALIFFYITAMIFIFGAEFNYHLERLRGHKIEEKEEV